MIKDKVNLILIIILVVVIVGSGIVAWVKYSPTQQVEISLPSGQELKGRVYIDGAVTIPGSYPYTNGDTIGVLFQAAGGLDDSANLTGLKLYVPQNGGLEPQKVDINRAEVWLLEALPEIGETLAQRIVDYRQQHGPFNNVSDLLKVSGIGTDTFEKIKDKITVAD